MLRVIPLRKDSPQKKNPTRRVLPRAILSRVGYSCTYNPPLNLLKFKINLSGLRLTQWNKCSEVLVNLRYLIVIELKLTFRFSETHTTPAQTVQEPQVFSVSNTELKDFCDFTVTRTKLPIKDLCSTLYL